MIKDSFWEKTKVDILVLPTPIFILNLIISFFPSFFPMFRIRIRLDPFHFGQPDPDPFHETDPETDMDGKKSATFKENFHQNHKNIIFFRKFETYD